ncbi:MAG: phage scaffolding protein [Firmicutes bacterium]|nr:phage scaffolding protein [Bacillota bacterium]
MDDLTKKQGKGTLSSKKTKSSEGRETIMIPKHRFDCVSFCLKETKQSLLEKSLENDIARVEIVELKIALLKSKAETVLALHRAKNLKAVLALIDFDVLSLQDGVVVGLDQQIEKIKEENEYLFGQMEETNYVLVPVKANDALNKSITDYVTKRRKLK